jgi:hypothetical protein
MSTRLDRSIGFLSARCKTAFYRIDLFSLEGVK